MPSARVAIRNIAQLVVGYVVCSEKWTWTVGVLWMASAVHSGTEWSIDVWRSLLALGPFLGSFFRAREVWTLPVPRWQSRAARWLLGTLGAWALMVLARLGGTLLFRGSARLVGPALAVDAFGLCVVASVAAVTAHLRDPRHPVWLRRTQAACTPVALISAPVWSSYLRGVTAAGTTSTATVTLSAATAALFILGFLVLPDPVPLVRARIVAKDLAEGTAADARAIRGLEGTVPGRGVKRWVVGAIRHAAITGLCAGAVATLMAAWALRHGDAARTSSRLLTGEYALDGEGSLYMVSLASLIWVLAMTTRLRFLRLLPLRRSVIAASLTGGLVVAFGSSFAFQAAVIGALGGRPRSADLAVVLAALTFAAGAKTVALAVGRGWLLLVILVLLPFMLATARSVGPLGSILSVTLAAAVLVVLMRIDTDLLAEQGHLYRDQAAEA